MKNPLEWFADRLYRSLSKRVIEKRCPDFKVNEKYLLRWYLIPRNPFFNVYLHQFKKSDYDRALHDHPWIWCSFILKGMYIEHSNRGQWSYFPGSIRVHRPKFAHRLEVPFGDIETVTTIFITGPRIRTWGFLDENGWTPHYEYEKVGETS